jgi:NAD(P)-dependent dehydrogenase (short-subunit alcohol dehydrogenase family)
MCDIAGENGRHDGSVALVTGAANGIGRATAERLAAEGATVVALDANEEALRAFERATPYKLDFQVVDVTAQSRIDELVEHVLATHCRVDAVANVAGIMDGFLSTHEVDDLTWSRVMAVNVDGPMRLARAVLPSMIERGKGAIINVSSEAGLRGGCAGAAYTTSKHAVIGLSKSIAWTYAAIGIRCNVVCPGSVNTEIAGVRRSDWAGDRQRAVAALSVRRADPHEIAATISWLASADAGNVNGAILTSDGGWSAA